MAPHCGTYVFKVLGQSLTTLTNHPLVVTTNKQTCHPQSIENVMIPYVNTVNDEVQFDSQAFTMQNSTIVVGLANQLLNATDYGVQVASCSPGFISGLLKSPTINIFNIEDDILSWCTPIKLETVCPLATGIP
ncbi:hypothetical protein NADFUDRAFT_69441 [Nadsonia fulvescens var. elongata DSM 6958]|uniref:Uncharacterized protein n=1 Tax=Nadsonia fulvescens var. elongata DSM 6958 TaxID=857566 RepID=A0A1E3PML8_9ASCO|nr:hypothetical protein NADFUDRAFT_69441 [Nadsonia fulvescens var. elongata DSM 6958]